MAALYSPNGDHLLYRQVLWYSLCILPISINCTLNNSHGFYLREHDLPLQVFREDGGDVHTHWVAYTEQMDRMVEESLRLNVKWSLQELSHAIYGDGKTMPDPVFKVRVVLKDGIQFSPSIEEVAGYINTVADAVISTISGFMRLPEILTSRRKGREVRRTKVVADTAP